MWSKPPCALFRTSGKGFQWWRRNLKCANKKQSSFYPYSSVRKWLFSGAKFLCSFVVLSNEPALSRVNWSRPSGASYEPSKARLEAVKQQLNVHQTEFKYWNRLHHRYWLWNRMHTTLFELTIIWIIDSFGRVIMMCFSVGFVLLDPSTINYRMCWSNYITYISENLFRSKNDINKFRCLRVSKKNFNANN